MSPALWALAGLCVAGLLLAVIGLVQTAVASLRLTRHLDALSRSRLILSLQSLKIQGERFGRLAAAAQPLIERAQTATSSIRQSLETLRLTQAQAALERTGSEIRELYRALR